MKQRNVCEAETRVVSHTGRVRLEEREGDLMDVSASADRLQSERLVVSIETLQEEIKKR